jgi:tetratricopeptide (TPR) repeat protein
VRIPFVFWLTALSAASASHARPQAAFSHSEMIERTLREIGGIGNLRSASSSQIDRLSGHLLARGQFLLDLYEFKRVLVRDHALFRDSVGRAGGATSRAAQYFLGRSWQEMGREQEAAAAFRIAGASAPPQLRQLTVLWSAGRNRTPRGWQQDVSDWRAGRVVTPSACPAATPSCSLFQAILASDITALLSLSRSLAAHLPPDYVESLPARGGSLSLDFYDPLPVYLLAVADFVVASEVLRNNERRQAARGLALVRAGRYVEGEAVLRRAVVADGATAGRLLAPLGEALYRAGRRPEAEQTWRSMKPQDAALRLDARTSLGIDLPTVLNEYTTERTRGFPGVSRESAAALARSLLRAGRGAEALDVLGFARPASAGADLDLVRPEVLVLFARARYATGQLPGHREHFQEARADLAALANVFPVAAPSLKLMQQVIAAPNVPAMRS